MLRALSPPAQSRNPDLERDLNPSTQAFDPTEEEEEEKTAMASEEEAVIACITKEVFDTQMAKAKEAGKLVIIDFTASWCGPCRFIAPTFIEYAKKFPSVVFLKVDVDELKEVAAANNIEGMPTFLFFKNGEKVDTVVGARKDELLARIQYHTASASA